MGDRRIDPKRQQPENEFDLPKMCEPNPLSAARRRADAMNHPGMISLIGL
jgi:hypothetical protein